MDLYVDVVTHGNNLWGTLSNAGWTAQLTGYRGVTNSGANMFRRYTFVIPPVAGSTPSPNGWGIAATTNGPGGMVSLLGFVADGFQIPAQSLRASENMTWPLYAQLYKGTGVAGGIWGWLQFSKTQPGVTGTVYWWRPAGIHSGGGYTAGFTNVVDIIGSPYTNSATALSWPTTGTALAYDGLATGVTNNVSVNNNVITVLNNATFPNTNYLALKITTLNGMVGGSFRNPVTHKGNSVRSIILQNQNTAAGFYTGTNAGAVLLQSP